MRTAVGLPGEGSDGGDDDPACGRREVRESRSSNAMEIARGWAGEWWRAVQDSLGRRSAGAHNLPLQRTGVRAAHPGR
jgi:hypothetical protein